MSEGSSPQKIVYSGKKVEQITDMIDVDQSTEALRVSA